MKIFFSPSIRFGRKGKLKNIKAEISQDGQGARY